MRPRSSQYPIGKLLISTLERSGLSIGPFVEAIGYRNSSKGVRAFDQIINYGAPSDVFIDRLISSHLAPEPDELNRALEASARIRKQETDDWLLAEKEEERQHFRPFVQGVPELSVPSPIFAFCLTGGHSSYTISLPEDIVTWADDEQHRYVKEVIIKNYADRKGRSNFMGPLTGYRLFLRYDERPIAYTTQGERLGAVDAHPLSGGTLNLWGRKLEANELGNLLQAKQVEE